jgi:DNA helicase-4
MNPGCYLLIFKGDALQLAVITRITPSQIEYDWIESGVRRFGILAKISQSELAELGIHKRKRVFGHLDGGTNLQLLQSSFAKIAAVSRAKEEAAEAVATERLAAEQALQIRLHEKRKELARRQTELDEFQQRKSNAFLQLDPKLKEDFNGAHAFWHEYLRSIISKDVFRERCIAFTQNWFERHPDLTLDEEQADAVAETGTHIQVTARAGSGKTRTLVARALFQIKHCRIPASSILILAFNKKAVEVIRARLGKLLSDEEMPHVLTFHALAYRIVRPEETLIYDEGETQEGQVFSATMQRVLDTELRGGTLEEELRLLMSARWAGDLEQIVASGYDLQKDEFFDFRSRMPRITMNGRKVKSETHKHIGNCLLRHRIQYSYRKSLQKNSGASYNPEFFHYNKDNDRRIIIEVLKDGSVASNPARDAFWKSDRASNSLLIQIPEEAAADEAEVTRCLVDGLRAHGVPLNPMSDDELWDAVKDHAIKDFTKAVKGFISRCQKELISPESLSHLVDRVAVHCLEIQERFWRMCAKIYSRYLCVLAEEKKTDFDQLMLNAAAMIQGGQTRFTSSRGAGNLTSIKHLLIDEFQDFSHLFNELRKSFITHSPDALFFCVGDDWQAINKFAGSDLSYFTGFQESFDPAVKKLISRNYRSFKKIVETGNQVMTGEGPPSIPNKTEEGRVLLVKIDNAIA